MTTRSMPVVFRPTPHQHIRVSLYQNNYCSRLLTKVRTSPLRRRIFCLFYFFQFTIIFFPNSGESVCQYYKINAISEHFVIMLANIYYIKLVREEVNKIHNVHSRTGKWPADVVRVSDNRTKQTYSIGCNIENAFRLLHY